MSSPEPLHFGNYQVLQRPDGSHWLLGEGGYGRTYKAEHRFLRRICALKIIHERYMRDERQRARFLQEAQTAARLSHRGIAHVYDFGEADGVFFYAMEFCEGGSLEELSRRSGPMAWPEVADFGGQVAEALACAHGAGLLHRDLKPQNVMLATPERPHVAKLIDFGLVKVLSERDSDSTWAMISREAGFKGNYATASPEQTGEDESLDERSDIFSLGVILWWLLIGRNPFEGMSNARVIADRLSQEPYEPRLPDGLDPRARAVVARMLEKRPGDRFASANEVLAALGEMYQRPATNSASTTTPPAQVTAAAAAPAAPPPLPAAPPPQRLSFEATFEVVATLDELAVGKLYRCRDGAGTHYSALVVENQLGRAAQEGMRRIGGPRAGDCFEWLGEWRGEGGQPVLVFGDLSPLRLLEVLKMLGGARLVELAPLLGRLARGLDGCQRDLGLGLELNPHILRVAGRGGVLRAWLDLDPDSLRTLPRLMLDEEADELSADTTIVSGDADFPVSAQFPSLVYRLVSGIPVKHAAYFTSAAYVPVAALSEEGNRLLARLISSEETGVGAAEFLEELALLEGVSAEFFQLRAAGVGRPVPAEPLAVRHVLEQQAQLAREQAARQAQEEAARRLREEAERQAREAAEQRARAEAERRAREEAVVREREAAAARVARLEAERRAEEEAARRAQAEAEAREVRAREEAVARVAAERRAAEEAERRAREEAARKVREEEAARVAREEAERRAREEAARKLREEEAARVAREETERRAREVAERKLREEEAARRAHEEAQRRAHEEAQRKAAEKAELKAARKAQRAAAAGRRLKPVVLASILGVVAIAGAAAVLGPRWLRSTPKPLRVAAPEPAPEPEPVAAGAFPTLRGTVDNLGPEDYRIRDRSGHEAQWDEELGRWKFTGNPATPLRVVLRDGLVFENLWQVGGSPVNQAEFPLHAVDLRGVRQVAGIQLPELKRAPDAEPEPARAEWVQVVAGDQPVQFRLEGDAGAGARRRALWLEPLAAAPTGQAGDFIERAAADVTAAPMAEGVEVALTLPGYRPQRFKHGDALPAGLLLTRAAVSARIHAAPPGQSGYGYESLVVQRTDDPTGGADPPPAEGVTLTAAELAAGTPLELPSGTYRLAFHGRGDEGDGQLLATAGVGVPDGCPEQAELTVPAELPGLDVKVAGKWLDFRTVRIEAGGGGVPAPPPARVLDAGELVLGWRDLAVAEKEVTHEIDLGQVIDEFDGEAEILLHPVAQKVSFTGSLLPAGVLPQPLDIDLASGPDGGPPPLAIGARHSGVYKASAEKGIACLPLPADLGEAAAIGFPLDQQPVLAWWHNLGAYTSLATYAEAYQKAYNARLPVATVYVEAVIDLSGREPSRFLYFTNLAEGWGANWGILRLPENASLAGGRVEFERVEFNATHLKWFSTKDDPGPRFRSGPAAPPQRFEEVVRAAAKPGYFRPWWALYQDWQGEAPEAGDPAACSATMRIALTAAPGGEPGLEIGALRELLAPGEQRWDPAITTLEPAGRVDEVRQAVAANHHGLFVFRLFDDPQLLTRGEKPTAALWAKVRAP